MTTSRKSKPTIPSSAKPKKKLTLTKETIGDLALSGRRARAVKGGVSGAKGSISGWTYSRSSVA